MIDGREFQREIPNDRRTTNADPFKVELRLPVKKYITRERERRA
jgi:hypothetical protein